MGDTKLDNTTHGNPAFALSRGSCGAAPSAPSSDPRFSDMLFSPPAFRLQVNRMTQEQPSGLLLTASGIQHRVPRRTVALHPAQALVSRSASDDSLPAARPSRGPFNGTNSI